MRTRLKSVVLLIVGLFISTSLQAQNIQVKASAPNQVGVGQSFRLTYSCNERISSVDVPKTNAFTLLSGPQTSSSSSMQIINGQMTSSSTYSWTYIMQADKEGTYDIPGAIVNVNGKGIRSNSVRIQVIASSSQQAQQGNNQRPSAQSQTFDKNDFFIKAFVSNTNPYVEEQVIIQYKLYLGPQAQRYQASIRKLPSSTGFWTYDLNDKDAEPARTTETINGKKYTVMDLYAVAVFPQKTGKLSISPLEVQTIVQVVMQQQQRSNNPWDVFFNDPFFGGGRVQNIELELKSNPVTLNVKELPKNKPVDFSGLVGNFTMKASLSRNKLSTDNATNFSITISGSGNLQHIQAPEIEFPSDFDVHEPNIMDNIQKGANGVSGSRTFEYVIIPRNPGDFVIPAANFSYYDKTKKQYVTLTTNEIPLKVEKGKGQAGQYYSSSNKKNVQIIGTDIRYIKTTDTQLKTKHNAFFLTPLYWLLLFLPFIGFVLFVILLRKQIENKKNMAKIKDKKASKLARKRLLKAEKYMKSGNNEQFYIEISQALWGYISDKFHIPLVELSLDTTRRKLEERNLKPELIDECMNVLNQCEYERFAPASDTTAQMLYEMSFRFITAIENEIKKM
ncbi:MAG TPA: BatD family protein [Bacteroidales bacterium]|mgnify:CR=1 FL=1|nr:BatD family protein [Bacteroidales bacterium]